MGKLIDLDKERTLRRLFDTDKPNKQTNKDQEERNKRNDRVLRSFRIRKKDSDN